MGKAKKNGARARRPAPPRYKSQRIPVVGEHGALLFHTHPDKADRLLHLNNAVPVKDGSSIQAVSIYPAHPKRASYEDIDRFHFAISTAVLRDCMTAAARAQFNADFGIRDWA